MIKNMFQKKFLLFVLLILPISVNALSGTVTLSCGSGDVKPGDEVTCTVKGTSSPTGVTQFDFNLTVGEGLTFKDLREPGDDLAKLFLFKNSWQGEITDLSNGHVAGYRSSETGESFNIGEFVVIVGNDTSGKSIPVTISNVKYSLDEESGTGEGASTTIKVASDTPEVSPKINNITVLSGGIMSPAFVESSDNAIWLDTAETTKFKLKVDIDEGLELSAKITGTDTSIDLTKDITYVANGDTSMSITITVTNGKDSKNYVLLIYRPKPSVVGDAVLETLTVGGYNVNLKSGLYNYSVTLSSSAITNGYVVQTKLADEENFKFDNYSKSYINKTIYGDNPIQLTIVPKEEGSGYGSNTYIISIVKEGSSAPSSTTPVTPKSSGKDVNSNPNTGRSSGIVMGIILIVSFFASIYYYKKNMSEYN